MTTKSGSTIGIQLTEHESMMLGAESMVANAQELVLTLQKISELLPTVSTQGQFSSRILNGEQGEMSRFVLKAQTFALLADVLSRHISNTYSAFIDMDELIAKKIIMDELNNPNSEWTDEDKAAIRQNPDEAIAQVTQAVREERLAQEAAAAQQGTAQVETPTPGGGSTRQQEALIE